MGQRVFGIFQVIILFWGINVRAQAGHRLWLSEGKTTAVKVVLSPGALPGKYPSAGPDRGGEGILCDRALQSSRVGLDEWGIQKVRLYNGPGAVE